MLTGDREPGEGHLGDLGPDGRARQQGYHVVPHLAARMISGRGELAQVVDRLKGLGIDDVFCPAGDADPPAGEYVGALAMLEHLTEMGSPFAQVGITGYPESHPAIEDDVAIQSMWNSAVMRRTS